MDERYLLALPGAVLEDMILLSEDMILLSTCNEDY
jgi:hypothetical protein